MILCIRLTIPRKVRSKALNDSYLIEVMDKAYAKCMEQSGKYKRGPQIVVAQYTHPV